MNYTLTSLLALYALIQLSTLFLRSTVALLAYELFYVAAIVVGIVWTIRKTKEDRNLKTVGRTTMMFLLVNLGLFLIYIPTLLLNPSINWKLKGEHESDPMILLAFWPPVHFLIAFVVIGSTGVITRLTITNKQ